MRKRSSGKKGTLRNEAADQNEGSIFCVMCLESSGVREKETEKEEKSFNWAGIC